ncbi:MAG: hypothetical protein LBR81_08685 [Prevotellaceae bacterium]|jgi:hypothetical protein|nr:hypothetical protein [Prevotellaceae bacterium]
MKKILDYYYLVLLRWNDYTTSIEDRLSYYVPNFMSFTIILNLFSLSVLFNNSIVGNGIFWITLFIVYIAIYLMIDIIYNKKRREELREKYKDESAESRKLGVVKVVLYELVSIGFVILSVAIAVT